MDPDRSYRSPFTIGRTGASVSLSEQGLGKLTRAFTNHHCIKLAGVVEQDLLDGILPRIASAPFVERVHEGIADNLEACMQDDRLSGLLHFLFNSPRLFRLLESITESERIGSFGGRVYRFSPAAGHHDAWHDDLDGKRLLAMSLNLGGPYDGGILEIRDRRTRSILHRASNPVAGDAIIFRLSPELQHRVTPVTGATPRTAFAGWYQTAPDIRDLLRELRTSFRGRMTE